LYSRERKRVVREEGARMAALRSGDTAAYMELLDNAKNHRLKELLTKTDDLLTQLGEKVQQLKENGENEDEAGINYESCLRGNYGLFYIS
jgi:hypothetical protein